MTRYSFNGDPQDVFREIARLLPLAKTSDDFNYIHDLNARRLFFSIAQPNGQPSRHKAQTKKPMRSPAAASRTDKADPRGA